MAETCIVCLGDLGESVNDLPHTFDQTVKSEPVSKDDSNEPSEETRNALSKAVDDRALVIAHLLPCGHNLHDECLRPWVERANSCPICRQNFHQVELSRTVGGKLKNESLATISRLIGCL